MAKKLYNILLEDTGRTHNINMHSFDCLAANKEEAIGKMYFARPDFRGWRINKITAEGETEWEDADYAKSIATAMKRLETIKNFKNTNLRYGLDKVVAWQDAAEEAGDVLAVDKSFIAGDELNQEGDMWYIDIADVESYLYHKEEDRDADYAALRYFLNERTKNFQY